MLELADGGHSTKHPHPKGGLVREMFAFIPGKAWMLLNGRRSLKSRIDARLPDPPPGTKDNQPTTTTLKSRTFQPERRYADSAG